MRWTVPLCQGQASTLAIAAFGPTRASETASSTPRSRRAFSERRGFIQKAPEPTSPCSAPSWVETSASIGALANYVTTERKKSSKRPSATAATASEFVMLCIAVIVVLIAVRFGYESTRLTLRRADITLIWFGHPGAFTPRGAS